MLTPPYTKFDHSSAGMLKCSNTKLGMRAGEVDSVW